MHIVGVFQVLLSTLEGSTGTMSATEVQQMQLGSVINDKTKAGFFRLRFSAGGTCSAVDSETVKWCQTGCGPGILSSGRAMG